ncbi:MAG: DUF1830 domain-containing protein [Microcoleaceae cyanobacterium]
MSSTINRLPVECINKTLCCYYNATDQIQIARISNIHDWYLERVVFPHEYFLFEAPLMAELEVYQETNSIPQLLNKLPCDSLQVEEETELQIVC